jgi:hypothetical protein
VIRPEVDGANSPEPSMAHCPLALQRRGGSRGGAADSTGRAVRRPYQLAGRIIRTAPVIFLAELRLGGLISYVAIPGDHLEVSRVRLNRMRRPVGRGDDVGPVGRRNCGRPPPITAEPSRVGFAAVLPERRHPAAGRVARRTGSAAHSHSRPAWIHDRVVRQRLGQPADDDSSGGRRVGGDRSQAEGAEDHAGQNARRSFPSWNSWGEGADAKDSYRYADMADAALRDGTSRMIQ